MACELDKTKLTRQEAYDQILNRKLDSQEPEVGHQYRDYVVAILIISGLMLGLILILTMSSGYRRNEDEVEEGFFDNYGEYRKSHIVISVCLLVILILFIPVTYEFVMVTLATMSDVKFF